MIFLTGGVLVGIALLWFGGGVTADLNLPEFPRGKGENCVEPTEIMRKDHFHFLTHQRDLTVHNGIRGARHSLVGCVQCHVQTDAGGQFIPINAPGQFCQACHAFASVELDCFECHATRPDGDGAGHLTSQSRHSPHPPYSLAPPGNALAGRESGWSFLRIPRGGKAQ